MVRIISIDVGNHYTGLVVADTNDDTFTVHYMDVIKDESKAKDHLHNVLQDVIIPYIQDPKNTILVMENVFMYPNYALQAVHRKVKKWITTATPGILYRCLLPSQKSSAGLQANRNLSSGSDKQRKKYAMEAATHLLTTVLQDGTHASKLQELSRAHDAADALLAAYYLHENPDRIPTASSNKSRKRKRS